MNLTRKRLVQRLRKRTFHHLLLFIVIFGCALGEVSATYASPPDEPFQATTPAGANLWMLSVTEQFQPSDVEAIGGTCHWHWPDAGIALASSSSDTFEEDAEGGKGHQHIHWAVPDAILLEVPPEAGVTVTDDQLRQAADEVASWVPEGYAPPEDESFSFGVGLLPIVGGADVYAINGQWALYAMGAARPKEIPPVYSTPVHAGPGPKKPLFKTHYTPEWELDKIDGHDYAGSGVTIGFVDSGIPAVWLDGPEPTVPVLDENGNQIVDWYGNPVFVHECELHPEFDWFDPDFPEDGGVVPPGYDAGVPNWMRLDGFDDQEGHGTATAGLLGARHWKQAHGAMRGLTPKARIICYNIRGPQGLQWSRIVRAWKRAADDGVQIFNNSIISAFYPWQSSGVWSDRFQTLKKNAANELSRRGVLLVTSAGNGARRIERDHGCPSFFHLWPQDLPNVLTVSGTGPRDYEPFQLAWEPKLDLSLYMPDAPGRPYDLPNRVFNLDRPMLRYPWLPPRFLEPTFTGGTSFGGAVDIAAPSGAQDNRPLFDPNNPSWPAFEFFMSSNNLMYTPYPLPNTLLRSPFTPDVDYGLHGLWAGTSFSAPYTSGVAALAMEAYKRQWGEWPTAATLRHIVVTSADDLVGSFTEDQAVFDPDYHEDPQLPCEKPGQDRFYGSGRVNAFNAIIHAKAFK